MDFYWSKIKSLLLLMAMGVVLSAAAQEAGREIIFSAPQSDGSQAVIPSLMPQNSELPALPGTLLAPVSPLPDTVMGEHLPPPPYSSGPRMKPSPEERRNWTLMTPAEIFGVTPADKLLQAPERDAFGREKNPTQLERYLARENQPQLGATNGWRSDRANSPWSLSREDDDAASPFNRRLDGTADPMQNLNRFLDYQQNKNTSAVENGKLDENTFDAFAKQKQTQDKLDQMAAMQRFRQMMQPSVAASANSPFFPAPKPAVDPNFTQPAFVPNPAGASFTPLTSGLGRPTGLTPLPGAFSSRLQTVTDPNWKPQPPPWFSQSPQPTAFPAQKF